MEVGTRTVGSQTSIFTTDLGILQQWRSIQGAYLVELLRLQHRIYFIFAHIGKEEPGAAERQSTDDLQNLQDRIRSITCDTEPWTAAAAQKPQWASCQQARPINLPKRDGPRQQPRQRSRSRRGPLRPWPSMPRRVLAPHGIVLTVTQRGREGSCPQQGQDAATKLRRSSGRVPGSRPRVILSCEGSTHPVTFAATHLSLVLCPH